jgi:hypothetical protein
LKAAGTNSRVDQTDVIGLLKRLDESNGIRNLRAFTKQQAKQWGKKEKET